MRGRGLSVDGGGVVQRGVRLRLLRHIGVLKLLIVVDVYVRLVCSDRSWFAA